MPLKSPILGHKIKTTCIWWMKLHRMLKTNYIYYIQQCLAPERSQIFKFSTSLYYQPLPFYRSRTIFHTLLYYYTFARVCCWNKEMFFIKLSFHCWAHYSFLQHFAVIVFQPRLLNFLAVGFSYIKVNVLICFISFWKWCRDV